MSIYITHRRKKTSNAQSLIKFYFVRVFITPCSPLTLRRPNLFFFTLNYITYTFYILKQKPILLLTIATVVT